MRNTGVKYRVVAKILSDNGWSTVRQSGSHVIWGKGSTRMSIPNRPDGVNRMLVRRLFNSNGLWPIPR